MRFLMFWRRSSNMRVPRLHFLCVSWWRCQASQLWWCGLHFQRQRQWFLAVTLKQNSGTNHSHISECKGENNWRLTTHKHMTLFEDPTRYDPFHTARLGGTILHTLFLVDFGLTTFLGGTPLLTYMKLTFTAGNLTWPGSQNWGKTAEMFRPHGPSQVDCLSNSGIEPSWTVWERFCYCPLPSSIIFNLRVIIDVGIDVLEEPSLGVLKVEVDVSGAVLFLNPIHLVLFASDSIDLFSSYMQFIMFFMVCQGQWKIFFILFFVHVISS